MQYAFTMFHRVSPEKARNLQSSAPEPLQSDNTAEESLPSDHPAEESLQSNNTAAEEPKTNGASSSNGASTSNGASNTVKPTTRAEFEAVFPSIVQDLTEHCKRYNSPENAVNWFRTVRKDCQFPCEQKD